MTDATHHRADQGEAGEVRHHPVYGPALPSRNWVPAPRYLLRRDRVLRHLRDVAPCRVIDVGCGPAALLSELAARGFDATGVDRSEDALRLARLFDRPGAPMNLRREINPDWHENFDLLLSFEVIEHLEEDVAALRDWRSCLRPGGRLILSTPGHPSRWNAADVWAGHVRRYTKEGLIATVEAAGFEVETIECYGFPLANIFELWRARVYGRALERKRKSGKSAKELTGESGSDRSAESRLWPLFATFPIAMTMRLGCMLQRPFLGTQLGNGFLVVARKA